MGHLQRDADGHLLRFADGHLMRECCCDDPSDCAIYVEFTIPADADCWLDANCDGTSWAYTLTKVSTYYWYEDASVTLRINLYADDPGEYQMTLICRIKPSLNACWYGVCRHIPVTTFNPCDGGPEFVFQVEAGSGCFVPTTVTAVIV